MLQNIHPHRPAIRPVVSEADKARIAELLAIPRSSWTTAQLRELLELIARELSQ